MDKQRKARYKNPKLVFNNKNRRFDGGTEIELIEYIEKKQAEAKIKKQYAKDVARLQKANKGELPEQKKTISRKQVRAVFNKIKKSKKTRSKKVLEAIIVGPLHLAIGSVGVLSSLLAIFSFTWMKQDKLVAQSKIVLKESLRTTVRGIGKTLISPVKVIKAALV